MVEHFYSTKLLAKVKSWSTTLMYCNIVTNCIIVKSALSAVIGGARSLTTISTSYHVGDLGEKNANGCQGCVDSHLWF